MNNDELIIEQVTDGSTVTRKWLGFTDKEILFLLVGVTGSACLVMLNNIGISMLVLAPIIPIPFVLSLIILFTLVYKKPPHYAEDLLDGACYGSSYCPHNKKFSYVPDGMFVDDVIIWGDLGDGSWSCGLSLLIPPMDYAQNEDRNNLKHRIDSMLNFFAKEKLRVQFYWSVGDNYTELQDYDRCTEELAPESVCFKYRKERSKEYEKQVSSRELRREQLVIFISSEISECLSNNLSSDTYDKASDELLRNIKTHARQQLNRASSFFETIGIASKRLNTLELCLGKAITYAQNRKSIMRNYLNELRFKIDNNAAENSIRPITLGRRNYLFVGSERGGETAAILMSLISTCKANKINPNKYLKDILRRINSHPHKCLAELLPYNWQANQK